MERVETQMEKRAGQGQVAGKGKDDEQLERMPVLVVLKKASSWRSSASKSADRILTFSLVMPMVNSPARARP